MFNSRIWRQLLLVLLALNGATALRAAELFWDANGATAGVGGTGNWTGGSTWRSGSDTGALQAWADGNSARFSATAAITLNGNVALSAITNTGGNVAQIIGSGGNTIDFGAGGTFVSGGNTISMRSSAPFKGNVTLASTSGTLAQTVGIWVKADSTLLTNVTVTGVSLASVLADHVGALGTSGSTVLITNGAVLALGALTAEPVGSVANNGSGGGLSMNAFTNIIGGGYIRSRAGSNTLNGPITVTATGSGFITRAAAGVALTLASTAPLNLNAHTLNLNVDSSSSGVFINSVVSGTGGMQTVGTGTVTSGANGTGTTVLGASNSFSGTALTSQNLGTLALGHSNALMAATLDTGASGSQAVTFIIAGNNTYNIGALTGSDPLAIGGNTISVGAKGGDTTFSAVISGSGGKLTKVGAGKLTLNAANTYDGLTTLNNGTLALGASGSLVAAASVSIGSSATFDVSAIASYSWGASASLAATGTASTPAVLKGGTTVDLGSRPVSLTYTPDGFASDANSAALNISQGALTLNGVITVVNNGGTALGEGTYVLIAQASGSISGTPTLSGTVGGSGIEAGKTAFLQVTGGNVELVVQGALPTTTTLYRTNSTPSSSTYGDTLQFGVSISTNAATGTVELRNGGPSGTVVGSGTLSGGVAIITPADNALAVGTHTNLVALYLGDVNFQSSSSAALSPGQSVSAKALTVTGAAGVNKYYDATTAATVTGTLVGIESGDTVTLIGTGTFDNAGPGTGINVTSTSTLGGASAGNYTLTQPTGLSADIAAAAIWTGTAADTLWNSSGNWTPNGVPAGANVTADFTTLDITTSQTVNLNSARTIGNLKFGDTATGTAASWTLANNGSAGNILTLEGTTPTVTVNELGAGAKATISAVVAGTSGLNKAGSGTLLLSGGNTFTGSTVISNGTVIINADSGLGTAPGAPTSGSISLQGGALQTTFNGSLSPNRSITVGASGGTLTNAAGGTANLTYTGLIEGPGTLTLGAAANGGFVISNPNSTYGGGSIFTAPAAANGVFFMVNSVGSPGSLTSGPFGTGKITFNGASTRATASASITNGNQIDFAADTTFATVAGEKSLTLEGPVTLVGGSRILTVNIGATVATEALTLSGAIGDAANGYGLTKAGTGKLVLSGTNTYTGATAVTGGTLALARNNTLSQYNNLSVSGNATLALGTGDGSTGWSEAQIDALLGTSGFTLSSGAIFGFDTSVGDFTYGTSIAGSPAYGISKLGTNTLTLSGNNTYTGPTVVTAGTLKAGSSTALGATSALSLSGTGTLDLGGNSLFVTNISASVAANTITNSGAGSGTDTLTITNLTTTIAAKVTDNGTRKMALALSGGNSFDPLSNTANDFSGGLNLNSLIRLVAADNSAVTGGKFGKGPITIGTAAQLYYSGANRTIGNDIIVNDNTGNGSRAGSFRVDTAGNILSGTITANLAPATFNCGGGIGGISLTGKVTGTNGLTVGNPNGTSMNLTLNTTANLNDYQGLTSIPNLTATLTLGAADQIPNGIGKGGVSVAGTLNLAGFSETINGLVGGGNVDGASGTPTLTVGDGDATNTFSGVIKNTGGTLSLTKIGGGTQTFSGANTYTGPTLISAGTLQIGNSGSAGSISPSSSITVNGTLAFRRSDTITQGTHFASGITGNGGLSQDGSGTTILNSANNYDGTTTVTAGVLNVQNASALGSTVGGTVVTAGRLELQGVTVAGESVTVNASGGNFFGALQGASGVNEWQGGVTVGSASGTRIGVNTGTFTISGAIGGSVETNGVTFRPNTGTLILSGANNYLGDTAIICNPGGLVKLAGGNNRLPVATKLLFGASGVSGSLDLNGTSQEVVGLTAVSGTANFITNSSSTLSTLTVNSTNGTTYTWSQTLGGNLDLIKAGPDKFILSGTNTYTGLTAVSNGTLLVNGSISGAATVHTNATLGGTGTLGGAVTVEPGGILAAGASVGTLTFGAAPVLNGTIVAELNQTNAQTADLLALTIGNWAYGGTLTITNIGPALSSGTFTLFNASAGTYGGAFATLNLPPGGLNHWKTNNLIVDGTITFTNNPPTARAVTNSVAQGGSVSITNNPGKNPIATDADADSLTFAVIAQPAGGTATATGSGVLYTNTAGTANVYDTLTYTVSDGVGGVATNTMTVWIQSAQGFNLLSQTNTVTDAYLTYLGIPGQAYVSERATNLTPPVVWTPLATNTAQPTNGALPGRVSFTNAFDGPVNFFRTHAQ